MKFRNIFISFNYTIYTVSTVTSNQRNITSSRRTLQSHAFTPRLQMVIIGEQGKSSAS